MKSTTLKAISLAITLSGPLLIIPMSAVAVETAEKTAIPDTADGILKAIDVKSAELEQIIDAKALDKVHHVAFAIRDLVAALPAKSASLSADKQAKVKGNVKFVATLAERLDATGDANDLPGTQSNYKKLTAVLASIHGNYKAAP